MVTSNLNIACCKLRYNQLVIRQWVYTILHISNSSIIRIIDNRLTCKLNFKMPCSVNLIGLNTNHILDEDSVSF